MKLNKDFILKEMKDADGSVKNYAIAVGKTAKNFKGMIKLNETAAFIWNKIKDGANEGEIVAALCDEYDVDEIQASVDVANILKNLREINAVIDD